SAAVLAAVLAQPLAAQDVPGSPSGDAPQAGAPDAPAPSDPAQDDAAAADRDPDEAPLGITGSSGPEDLIGRRVLSSDGTELGTVSLANDDTLTVNLDEPSMNGATQSVRVSAEGEIDADGNLVIPITADEFAAAVQQEI
ncbi:MAG: hypothetical protein ACU0AT_01770, partial [Tranquillimonas sp.]